MRRTRGIRRLGPRLVVVVVGPVVVQALPGLLVVVAVEDLGVGPEAAALHPAQDLGVRLAIGEVQVPGRVLGCAREGRDDDHVALGIDPVGERDLVRLARFPPDRLQHDVVHARDHPDRVVVRGLHRGNVLAADPGNLVARRLDEGLVLLSVAHDAARYPAETRLRNFTCLIPRLGVPAVTLVCDGWGSFCFAAPGRAPAVRRPSGLRERDRPGRGLRDLPALPRRGRRHRRGPRAGLLAGRVAARDAPGRAGPADHRNRAAHRALGAGAVDGQRLRLLPAADPRSDARRHGVPAVGRAPRSRSPAGSPATSARSRSTSRRRCR